MPPSYALFGGFASGARVAFLWQHYGNAWQSPAVIRQAHRTSHACRTHTLRMPAKTPLAGDKIDAPAACAIPFRPYCGCVATRTRNVSEYMLVLALCLVLLCVQFLCRKNVKSFLQACKTVFDLKDRDLFEHSDLVEIAEFGKVC